MQTFWSQDIELAAKSILAPKGGPRIGEEAASWHLLPPTPQGACTGQAAGPHDHPEGPRPGVWKHVHYPLVICGQLNQHYPQIRGEQQKVRQEQQKVRQEQQEVRQEHRLGQCQVQSNCSINAVASN